jgi:hypothetical protein
MEHLSDFKRMLLGLPHSGGDYVSVAFAAELAELLGLDLVGLFVEDQSMARLADLPCVRELRSFGGGWHPIDAALLAHGAAHRAREARRLFEAVAKTLRVGTRFDLARGSVSDAIASQSSVSDIIVVIEPKNPAERVTHQFVQFLDVALNARSAVLLVPSRLSRRKGPVVAVAQNERDSSIGAAARIAHSLKEQLIVLAPPDLDEAAIARLAGMGAASVDRISLGRGRTGAGELATQLSRVSERFLVLSRAMANQNLPTQLASGRGVPVLVAEAATARESN